MTFDSWLFTHAVELNDTVQSKADLCRTAWNAAVAEEREACHVEGRPDGYWLVLKNKSGEAAINLDGPSRGPIVRAVIKEAGG